MSADARPRRSLVLAGGGMRVAYQAGVLQALNEAGLVFDHADGTSGGTINLAMLLSGLSPVEMCARWRSLNVHDFVSFLPLHEYLKGPEVRAMGDADGIVERVFPHLGIDAAAIRACRSLAGTFNVCNFAKKTNEVITHDRMTLPHLIAGISLPVFMPAVMIDGEAYTDAVWIKDANLMEAVRRGAEEIWLVWCIGNTPDFNDGAFQQYVHMIEMSANGALFGELEQIADVNAAIARGDSRYEQRSPIVVHVIKPEYPLPLDPDYYLGRIDGATLVAMGYADAREYCASLGARSGGAPLSFEATRMRRSRPGIAFRETLAGTLELEPSALPGVPSAVPLRVAVSICIEDLDRFIADRSHRGRIDAMLDAPPIGSGIPCMHGRLESVASGAQGHRTIRYVLPFMHAGKAYVLEGEKSLTHSGGDGLAEELTTLRARLRAGDESGPILGTAVLRMDAAALVQMVKSVSAIHCPTVEESAATVAKFGKFLFCELFDELRATRSRRWWQFWSCSA